MKNTLDHPDLFFCSSTRSARSFSNASLWLSEYFSFNRFSNEAFSSRLSFYVSFFGDDSLGGSRFLINYSRFFFVTATEEESDAFFWFFPFSFIFMLIVVFTLYCGDSRWLLMNGDGDDIVCGFYSSVVMNKNKGYLICPLPDGIISLWWMKICCFYYIIIFVTIRVVDLEHCSKPLIWYNFRAVIFGAVGLKYYITNDWWLRW